MKVWFITGASRGIGTLITKEALACGDAVMATARNPERLVSELRSHPNFLVAKLDVTDEAQAEDAVEQAISRFGRIDVLVNNAGYGLLGAVEEVTPVEVEAVYATNVFGLLKVTRAVLPYMRRQRSGHILNFSSVGGYSGYPGWGVYGSTKFAVEGLSESLAAEVKPFGINVTIIRPGFFRTEFLSDASLSVSSASISDYVGTPAGDMRKFASAANHAQPGDPALLAKGVLTLVNAPNPPLSMPFGSDTIAVMEEKIASTTEELGRWRDLAISTDYLD